MENTTHIFKNFIKNYFFDYKFSSLFYAFVVCSMPIYAFQQTKSELRIANSEKDDKIIVLEYDNKEINKRNDMLAKKVDTLERANKQLLQENKNLKDKISSLEKQHSNMYFETKSNMVEKNPKILTSSNKTENAKIEAKREAIQNIFGKDNFYIFENLEKVGFKLLQVDKDKIIISAKDTSIFDAQGNLENIPKERIETFRNFLIQNAEWQLIVSKNIVEKERQKINLQKAQEIQGYFLKNNFIAYLDGNFHKYRVLSEKSSEKSTMSQSDIITLSFTKKGNYPISNK